MGQIWYRIRIYWVTAGFGPFSKYKGQGFKLSLTLYRPKSNLLAAPVRRIEATWSIIFVNGINADVSSDAFVWLFALAVADYRSISKPNSLVWNFYMQLNCLHVNS